MNTIASMPTPAVARVPCSADLPAVGRLIAVFTSFRELAYPPTTGVPAFRVDSRQQAPRTWTTFLGGNGTFGAWPGEKRSRRFNRAINFNSGNFCSCAGPSSG
jgi:hypothetical protein